MNEFICTPEDIRRAKRRQRAAVDKVSRLIRERDGWRYRRRRSGEGVDKHIDFEAIDYRLTEEIDEAIGYVVSDRFETYRAKR